MEEQELTLTDLIDRDILQSIQNAFSDLTGMAALTTDNNGVPVTQGSNFCDFCKKYTRASPEGKWRCRICDKRGAEATLEEGESSTYVCHAGLIEFSAPIIANGKLVGCFIGGQILSKPLDEHYIKKIAKEIDVDPEEYYAAARQIRILPQKTIERSANFLFTIANVLSDMAYGKYNAYLANAELERTSKMKSAFLANMSHEIRTPMNAVIGMAELALREEISLDARNYINQIKSSGRSLLTLINDILDFSKIESGKLELNIDNYEPMSLFHDVSNIMMTRIQDKEVELILNITPDLPSTLKGDANRIRQILINLLNNATKFTNKGRIRVTVTFEYKTEEQGILKVCVEDTGIGIKPADLKKIFNSFEQVDSKRNRNVEGTGLGLSICQQLVGLMHGEIWVESEYNKGSKFFFVIPQEISSEEKSVSIKEKDSVAFIALIKSPHLKDQMKKDASRLKVPAIFLDDDSDLTNRFENLKEKARNKKLFFIVEETFYSEDLNVLLTANPSVNGVVITGFYSEMEKEEITRSQNLLITKKPFSVLSLATILNQQELLTTKNFDNSMADFTFTAPDAQILLVDDNPINLTVAEGLLEPLKMKLTTALSGKEALDKISKKSFDIIFMDHMMPQMDGIECTHLIRENEAYKNVPIIALTANAIGSVKDMFIKEGMDDFVAKPIELKTIISKVQQWLPKEKIIISDTVNTEITQEPLPEISDLDVEQAVKRLGSIKLFNKVLLEFHHTISKKCETIEDYIRNKDWNGYTIEVHALKSSARQIGAIELSELAANLEKSGKEKDIPFILAKTPELFDLYHAYLGLLAPYCDKLEKEQNESETKKTPVSPEEKKSLLLKMKEAADNLDLDELEEYSTQIKSWELTETESETASKITEAVDSIDCESIVALCDKWLSMETNHSL
ncbi:MAG: PocR ligand-binding domain-containing protein [Treponema sp.]|nr:PocR ligand-binding domain-containing protein [Treponema sp.]